MAALNNAVAETVALAEIWPEHPQLFEVINAMEKAVERIRPVRPGIAA